jgi:hypothetical protein
MEYRLYQTDDDKWIPQVKNIFSIFGIPVWYKWADMGPETKYEDALVNLRKLATKLEKIMKIRENRQIKEFKPEELVKEEL